MPEKLNLPPENYQSQLEQPASDDDLILEIDQLPEAPDLAPEKSPSQVQAELDSLTEQARSLAEAGSQPESNQDSREKHRQAVAELKNQVGDSGLQQIELLAHGSERLNGFRAVIETGFNPSQELITTEIETIRELVKAKSDLSLQDYQAHSQVSALVKDQQLASVYKLRSADQYQADLNSLKLAIDDETAVKDSQLIGLIDAIPSQGQPEAITSAMETAIEAMRDRGSQFADSSTAQLVKLLQSMAQETAQ